MTHEPSIPGSILPNRVSLHNIDDIEGVIKHCIAKSGLRLNDDEYTELFQTGLVLIYEMSSKFKGGSFYGFVITFLPRKLGGAWHAMNETHVLMAQGTTRKWRYYRDPRSLHERTSDTADTPLIQSIDGENIRVPGNFIRPPLIVPD